MKAADAEKMVTRRLAELRNDAHWSQTDLASFMEERGWPWHQQTVGRVEHGQQSLRVGELADLADLFGVPAGDLLAPRGRDIAAERREVERAIRKQIATEIMAA